MHWQSLVCLVHALINCFGVPKMIFIYYGGNDIGLVSCSQLVFHLKFAIYTISKMRPGSMMVFFRVFYHDPHCVNQIIMLLWKKLENK